jgi:hypothetical protein
MTEWKTISSAPTDRSVFLAYRRDAMGSSYLQLCYWARPGFWANWNTEKELEFEPTHWLELPKIPEIEVP